MLLRCMCCAMHSTLNLFTYLQNEKQSTIVMCTLSDFAEAKRHVFQDRTVGEPGYYHSFYVDPSDDNSIYIGAL